LVGAVDDGQSGRLQFECVVLKQRRGREG
jgi:hypothetical protein